MNQIGPQVFHTEMRTYNRIQQTQKISVSKIKDVCRLCMNADTSMYDIFTLSEDNQSLSLPYKIQKCLSIEVKDSYEWPTKLCTCCLKSLNAYTAFWEQCHKTDKQLHKLIENCGKSTLHEAILQISSSDSGNDELYKSPEHSCLFSMDDEDPNINKSPVNFSQLPSDRSINEFSMGSNAEENLGEKTSDHPSEFLEDVPNHVPSGFSLFEDDVDADTLSRFELEEVGVINEEGNGVEVQVSMNGNSYIVQVLEQSSEEETNTDIVKARDDANKSPQNSNTMLVSDKKISYCCPNCKNSFNSISDLENHVKEHRDAKGFMCKLCFKCFSIKSGLVRHERIHSGERPYQCVHCSRSFTQKEVLSRHLLTHSGDKPFKCDSCHKSYTQKEALRMHVKNNHVPRKSVIMQYKCSLCDKSFCHMSGLSRHQRSHAGKKYPCKSCDRVYTDQSCLRRHNQKVHGVPVM